MLRSTDIHRFYSCIRGKNIRAFVAAKSHADLTDAPQHGYLQIFFRVFVAEIFEHSWQEIAR